MAAGENQEVKATNEKELGDYKGFTVVQDKENEIRRELHKIVDRDQQSKDITDVLHSAGKLVESTIKEAVESAIKKLDTDKGYLTIYSTNTHSIISSFAS